MQMVGALLSAEYGWKAMYAAPDPDGVCVERWPVVAWAAVGSGVRAVAATPQGMRLVDPDDEDFVALLDVRGDWESRDDVDSRMRAVLRATYDGEE